MRDISEKVRPKGVKVHASAEFTSDMADNLASIFQRSGDDGETVVVNFSNMGVWAVTSAGMRVFIGATEIFDLEGSNAKRPSIT